MKSLTRRGSAFGIAALVAAAALSACGSGSAKSLEDVTADLKGMGLCDGVEYSQDSGPVPLNSPAAKKVTRSFYCADSNPSSGGASFASAADRDEAARSVAGNIAYVIGTGDNLWVITVGSQEAAAKVLKQYGDAAKPAQ